MTDDDIGRHTTLVTDQRPALELPVGYRPPPPPVILAPSKPPVWDTLRQNPIRLILIPAAIVLSALGALAVLLWIVAEEEHRHAVQTSATKNADAGCEGAEAHYALKGTDCRDLPVVTDPGALGPANTGGPAGGTDWLPAYPGSNIWIPEYQVSGRLLVKLPGSQVPVPEGYQELGPGPDGMIFYWRPDDLPPPS
ncbi:hypothetical protein JRC04_07655 [Mycolicibacterium sp. S2-37]|uniref:hypothetical protein n=1 Tax=Mycolicibacterium sp. S2-37 TaxID=2810297 RepID=UPI001A93E4B2|nr:hypothetical protein [Mycolicibacterium sp. S2-37]MBO0677334.1 hypothetical protein [Mycolicibacterium sp. S2-37]